MVIKVLFFGSAADSVTVLEKLFHHPISDIQLLISGIVTQPPRPTGRYQELTPTPVESWARNHNIPVLSFPSDKKTPWLYENEQAVIDAIQPFKPDLLISASYGQKIPLATITGTKYGGLNVHPSLLPRWRGADPVPWAILSGDHQIGVTIVTLTEKFDEGTIIVQKKIPILPTDTTALLYPKLFLLGADPLVQSLQQLASKGVALKGSPQGKSPTPYARRLTKEDGFVSWQELKAAMEGQGADVVDRKFRAFTPWPGLWTLLRPDKWDSGGKATNGKRLKILKLHLARGKLVIDEVQLEGKKPVSFTQFSSVYLSTS